VQVHRLYRHVLQIPVLLCNRGSSRTVGSTSGEGATCRSVGGEGQPAGPSGGENPNNAAPVNLTFTLFGIHHSPLHVSEGNSPCMHWQGRISRRARIKLCSPHGPNGGNCPLCTPCREGTALLRQKICTTLSNNGPRIKQFETLSRSYIWVHGPSVNIWMVTRFIYRHHLVAIGY
jgi:hypothetical protein